MKLLAYQVVGFYTLKDLVGLPLTNWEKLESDSLKEKMGELEEGGIFRSLGIRNFLEGDLLSWYLQDWNSAIEKSIKDVIERLNQYDPETMELIPDETRDILKKLYQFLVPKVIRHDLGEYYTPDWLAERCLNQVGYGPKDSGLLTKRILDPGCGSGTFVILAIKRAREHARLKGLSPTETLAAITKNIVGFDLNPLAVISARTNYLLAIADLLKYKKGDVTIPIYLCDSINPPSAKEQQNLLDPEAGQYLITTSVGVFHFPDMLVKKELVQKVAEQLEDSVKRGFSTEKFLAQVVAGIELNASERQNFEVVLGKTHAKLLELDRKGINGIWARIIKNVFAPLFVGTFDFVIGNPPWVNWSALPREYRDATIPLWKKYSLFELKGLDARLGAACDDISVLMTYVSLDKYLRNGGKLCFVITQSLFKSVGGGAGFRRFRLGKQGQPVQVLQVDDMVELQPFDSATNRTAVFLCMKGKATRYPVEYHLWRKTTKTSIPLDASWQEVVQYTKVKQLKAQSVNNSAQGPWITAKPRALQAVAKIAGKSDYQARMGVHTGGANGLYWVTAYDWTNDGKVVVKNLFDIGKIKYRPVQQTVESRCVFPLLRGRDVQRWSATPSEYIILAQNPGEPSKAFAEETLKRESPGTFEYFEKFRKELLGRSHYKAHFESQRAPSYSVYNVGPYTFAPFKVVWRYIASDMTATVIEKLNSIHHGGSDIIPDTKLVIVACNSRNEAHYICAMLNSVLMRFAVRSFIISTQIAPHLLESIRIQRYIPGDEFHNALAEASISCHEKTRIGVDVDEIERRIDALAARVWGLSELELREIIESLEDIS